MKNKLVMTLLVRDEEDILEYNICHHLNQGVDFIIAIDNGSKDKTPEILDKYQKKGVLSFSVIKEHTYEQALWVSQMAKIAVNKFNATHLFHCDADEFWFPVDGNLKRVLPKRDEVFYVLVINYIPPQGLYDKAFSFRKFHYIVSRPYDYPSKLAKQRSYELLLYKYPMKILTPKDFTNITAGNHDVVADKPFKKVIHSKIFIHHFPIRSLQQFGERVIKGGSAMENSPIKDPNINWHIRSWYELYKKGELREEYNKLSLKENIQELEKQGVIKKVGVPRRIRWAKIIYRLKNIV